MTAQRDGAVDGLLSSHLPQAGSAAVCQSPLGTWGGSGDRLVADVDRTSLELD